MMNDGVYFLPMLCRSLKLQPAVEDKIRSPQMMDQLQAGAHQFTINYYQSS